MPTVAGVVLAVFLLIRLVPGDVATRMVGLDASISPRRVDELRRLFGLDRSLAAQFAEYAAAVGRYDFLRTPAELIQAQLAWIGIRLRINAADWSVYLPLVFQKKYALTILGTSGQSDPDDYLYGNFHSKGGLNLINYTDAAFDRLLDQGRAVADQQQRQRIYTQAQQRLFETVPMVFLFHSTQYEAVRRNVQGFQHWPNTSYLGLRRTWMTGREDRARGARTAPARSTASGG